MRAKTLYIIAGCNGAGKTSASISILPQILDCKEFVNADEIAKGLSPFNPESVAIEAGRLMLQRINVLLEGGNSFSIETTLSTKSYKSLIERAKDKGFYIQLLFFWLPSPEYAEKRVAQRVREGGHNIPTDVIHRRYWAGIKNLFEIYIPIVDSWMLIKNTKSREIIAKRDEVTDLIFNEKLYNKIKNYESRTK